MLNGLKLLSFISIWFVKATSFPKLYTFFKIVIKLLPIIPRY